LPRKKQGCAAALRWRSTPRSRRSQYSPFANISSDPEQDYFALGLAEDLITDLSKVPGLTVIARNSSFAYAGGATDAAAGELGVRYIVEGSVRRAANRVRINAQLIDTADRRHLWADRFDGDLADVFQLQDEVVTRIVGALSDTLPTMRPKRQRRVVDLEAYDLFLRGRALVLQSPAGFRAGHALLERAAEIDPGFADAQAWLAMSHVHGWFNWGEPFDQRHPQALAAARRAVALDPENASGHAFLGYVLLYDDAQPDEAAAEFAKALAIDPNYADAWTLQAEAYVHRGNAAASLDSIARGFALNPQPPAWYYWIKGFALYGARDYAGAVEALRHPATHETGSRRILAASLAQLGRLKEARHEAAEYMKTVPTFRIGPWLDAHRGMKNPADRENFVEGYRKAGLPD
jgi:TolB-like protein